MSSTSSLLNFLSPLFPSNTPQIPQTPSLSLPKNPSQPTTLSSTKPQTDFLGPLVSQKQDCPDDVMAVVCPSLAFSNTLFFDSACNVEILVEDDEPEERLLGRFRREVMRAGIIQETRRRQRHETNQEKAKRKSREAARRYGRRSRSFNRAFEGKEEETTKVDVDDDDNWEMPEGDTPY